MEIAACTPSGDGAPSIMVCATFHEGECNDREKEMAYTHTVTV